MQKQNFLQIRFSLTKGKWPFFWLVNDDGDQHFKKAVCLNRSRSLHVFQVDAGVLSVFLKQFISIPPGCVCVCVCLFCLSLCTSNKLAISPRCTQINRLIYWLIYMCLICLFDMSLWGPISNKLIFNSFGDLHTCYQAFLMLKQKLIQRYLMVAGWWLKSSFWPQWMKRTNNVQHEFPAAQKCSVFFYLKVEDQEDRYTCERYVTSYPPTSTFSFCIV